MVLIFYAHFAVKMSFKIVQTKEGGGSKRLSIVPSAWVIERRVDDGTSETTVKWPKPGMETQKTFNQMIKDANCSPKTKWPEYKCTLKRSDLTHAQALKIVGEMSGRSDTQASDSEFVVPITPPSTTKRMTTAGEKKMIPIANFCSMVCVFCI